MIRNARRLLVVPLLVLWNRAASAQGTDYIHTGDLAGRAIAFEAEAPQWFGVDSLTTVGDVNGDGVSDIGLVHTVQHFPAVASVYLLFGGSGWGERNVLRPELQNSVRFWGGTVSEYDIGEYQVGNVGDLNDNGYAEFAFGADLYRRPDLEGVRGALFIVYGEPGFAHSGELSEITNGIPGTIIYDTSPDVRIVGRSCVVDLNGDGRRELVLWGLRNLRTNPNSIVYVLLDPQNLGPRVDLKDIGETVPGVELFTPNGAVTFADVGDFDGDGFHDLLVNDQGGSSIGSVFVFFGRHDLQGGYGLQSLAERGEGVTQFLRPVSPETTDGFFFGGEKQASGVGDVNGDGFDDIVIGEAYANWNIAGGGVGRGRLYLIYGGPRWTTPIPVDQVPEERKRVIHGLSGTDLRDQFGYEVAAPGDVNGDGIPDLLTSAWRRWDEAGEAYLIHGRRDFPQDVFLAEGFEGIRIEGAHINGGLGRFLGPAGDFNADGKLDFLVGEPGLSNGHSSALVILGTGGGSPPLTGVGIEPRSGFVRGGTRVRIRGSGFQEGAQVRFGENAARVLEVSPTEIIVESPEAAGPGEVIVTVSARARTVALGERFEYVPDRPEIDLRNPGRWGLRIDDVPGTVLGQSLDFADIDADGIDDLLVGSDLVTDWVVTVVRGGRSLPETMQAFGPGDAKTQIVKRGVEPRSFWEVTVRAVGDVNGDGITDLGAAALAEATYLFFGRRNLEAELDFEAEVEAGRAVRLLCDTSVVRDFAPVGDLTGDGIDDFALSLYSESVLFIEGRREWPQELDLQDPSGYFSRLSREETRFARKFAAAGDVNGDGYQDLLVSGESFQTLTAYLVFTRPATELPQDSIIDHYIEAGGGVLFEWEARSGSSGSLAITVSGVGDANGDGIADFVLGDQQGTVSVPFKGVSYLVYGRRDFPWRIELPYSMGSPLDTEGVVRLGTDAVDQTGRCVGPAGDYNGDGYGDFLIGSQGNASLDGFGPGYIHVAFGGPELPQTLDLVDLGGRGFRLEGIRRSTWMTVASWTPGDLNADGADDFAFAEVSSPFWLLEDGVTIPPASVHVVYGIPPSVPFIRGDADGDGRLNITDGVFTLSHLFLGGVDPLCEDATDADDRGTVELTDAVYLLNHLFLGGSEPPPPYPTPGDDPTADQLGCRGF